MAQRTPTYTYGDALNIVSKSISRATEDDTAVFICNTATNLIWNKWDWRETIAQLPPFFLIPNEQDHGAPANIVPSDFFGLRKAWLIRTTTNPPLKVPLGILRDLDQTYARAIPQSISYNSATKSFRVFPRVPDNIGAPDFMIGGEYKLRPTKVSASTIATTTLPFDDVYFQVWIEVLKWAGYVAGGDQRAGEVQYQGGQITYTGQLAKAMAAMTEMASSEGLEMGDQQISPSEGLIGGRPSYGGLGILGW